MRTILSNIAAFCRIFAEKTKEIHNESAKNPDFSVKKLKNYIV